MKPSVNIDNSNRIISFKTANDMTFGDVMGLFTEIKKQADRFKYNNKDFSLEKDESNISFNSDDAKKQFESALTRIHSEYFN